MNLKTIFILFYFQINSLLACSDYDLRDYLPTQLQSRFAYSINQGNSGWCYSNAASDILSVHLNKPVSAMYLMTQYNSHLSGVDLAWRFPLKVTDPDGQVVPDGGRPDFALKESLKIYGTCDESIMPSDFQNKAKSVFINLKMAFKSNENPSKQEYLDILKNSNLFSYFPTLNIIEATNLIYPEKKPQKISFKLSQLACGQDPEIYPLLKVNNKYKGLKKLSRSVTEILDEKKAPLIGFLLDAKTLYSNFSGGFGAIERVVGNHVMTVIGQKSVNNQCEFLVRDSFGSLCEKYTNNVKCNGDGTIWMTTSYFDKITKQLTYITENN